jgi:ABC-2 type transport system ATP-binding protein
MTLEIRGITKRFGRLTAVDGLSFAIERGEICGFIGPNGAGKTTTMRVCATLELPDAGDVLADGVSVLEDPRRARARLGFMPDAYGAYANTTALEYLDFYGRAYGLRGRERARIVARVVDFTGLAPLAQKEIDALSKGMKQRLCLAKTLLHDPSILILDEPAAGLDPRARVELRELLRALADMRKAVLVSSHILSELAEMCHAVAVIENGRLRAKGPLDEVRRGLLPQSRVFLRALSGPEAAERALVERPKVGAVRRERDGVSFDFAGGEEELADLVAALVAQGLRPVEIARREGDLEDVFLTLTEGRAR